MTTKTNRTAIIVFSGWRKNGTRHHTLCSLLWRHHRRSSRRQNVNTMKMMMKDVQVDHHRHGRFCNINGAKLSKNVGSAGDCCSQEVVVNISGSKMVMILAIAASLSFSFGRFCQSRVPSLQRVLQYGVASVGFPLLIGPAGLSHFLLWQDDVKMVDSDVTLHDLDQVQDAVSNGAEHLMVDVTNVDPELLSSPDLLKEMLLRIFQEENTLNHEILSMAHTNGLDRVGGGLSFTALFLQSHAFLHAWPSTGILTLDIYKSRRRSTTAWTSSESDELKVQESLVNLVPMIHSLFANNENENDSNEQQRSAPPHFYWAIKDRGMDYDKDSSGPSDSVDYKIHYLGRNSFTHKELVASVKTPFQTFEVFEMVDLRDAEQKKDRILFLDHVVQSSRLGLEAYHEALVHPALLAHPNPKRVAIVGGGEGATMREVLKHATVEKVVMIEIDAAMVEASKIALLEWNDCSDLVGSVCSCFDDPRAEIHLEDAVGWFIDRFNKHESIPEEEKFDVIIMDALDPSSSVGFSDVLYGNLEFTQSMRNSLTDQGILIAQVGHADVPDDPGHDFNDEVGATSKMVQLFQQVGFESSLDYTELHCGFLAPWAFLISFLDSEEVARWYSSTATIDLELSNRAISTVSGDFPFKYFDGATMAAYQYPSRADQNVHCRSYPNAPGCITAGYRTMEPLPRLLLAPETAVLNGTSFRESVQSLSIKPITANLIATFSNSVVESLLWKPIETAMEIFGFGHKLFGSIGYMINPWLLKTTTTRPGEDAVTESSGVSCLEMIVNASQEMDNSFIARNQYLLLAGVHHSGAAVNGECQD